MFRVMRPLRIISRHEGLRTAVIALALAIPNILSIVLIALLFFIIFGILGVNYLKGVYFYCDQSQIALSSQIIEIHNKWDCINTGAVWKNLQINFDNIF